MVLGVFVPPTLAKKLKVNVKVHSLGTCLLVQMLHTGKYHQVALCRPGTVNSLHKTSLGKLVTYCLAIAISYQLQLA